MAISYGSITIVDITDIGEFSVYPTANSPRTQIYNPDTSRYIPDWSGSNPDTSLKITPVAYYASQNVSTAATYTWQRRDGAGNLTPLGPNESIITVDGNTGVLKVNSNILGDSISGIVSYIVTAHYTVDGVSLEAVGEIDFSLTRQGTTAKTAKINGENIFKYDSTGTLVPSGKTITLTGTVSGVTISGWKYYYPNSPSADVNGYVTYPNSSSTSSLVVNPTDNVFTNDSVRIKLVTNDSTVYDLITITKLYDGTKGDSVISAVLSNESQMLPANENGHVTSYNGANTILSIFKGGSNITNSWVISKVYVPSSLSSLDTAINDNEVDFSSTNISSTTFNNIDICDVTFICNKYILSEDTTVINDKDYFELKNDSYDIVTPIGNENPEALGWYEKEYDTVTKKFSITKVKTGVSGNSPTIYSLEASSLVVSTDSPINSIHPNPNPASVIFNAYQQTGNDPKISYSDGKIQFYINGNSSITDETQIAGSTRQINFTQSPWNAANRVEAVLYQNSNNTGELDRQTIVIVCDGAQGAEGRPGTNGFGAINVILGNEADVIPCTSANHPVSEFVIDIPFEGYQGTNITGTSVNPPPLSSTDFGVEISADTSITGHVKYTIPTTATLVSGGQISLTFTVNAQDYDNNGNIINTTVSITKLYTWTRSSAAIDGANAVVLQVAAEDGTIFENNHGTLYAKAVLYNGADEAAGERYTWYRYKDGQYELITPDTTNVVTGHGVKNTSTGVWSWENGENGSINNTSDMIKISAAAVDGYASFKVISNYTVNGVSKSFIQYISFIDKTDPLQISLHSTIGTQIKNSQGIGCIYARVIRGGVEIDTVPQGIQSGTTWPTSAPIGSYFVLLTENSDHTLRTAKLHKKTGSDTWTFINNVSGEARQCNYDWSFRDENNTPITTGIPYQDPTNKINNQFIYIDADLINGKITVDCKVTIN